MDDRILLVLDLDETLVYAAEEVLDGREPDHEIPPFHLYRRPGLSEFLTQVSEWYRLAVWTSSSPLYAQVVCATIFPGEMKLDFIWASDRCTSVRNFELDTWANTKPLKKLKRQGYDLSRVLMIDDSPEKHSKNYGNLVRVAPFEGDSADDELMHLAVYLSQLRTESDILRIEKREWRKKLAKAKDINLLQ